MKRLLFTIGLCLCTLGVAVGQTQILIEDFEDGTVGYSASVTEFSDGSEDFFTRTDGSNIAGGYSVSNIQGSSYFAAQDIDGEGASSQQTLTFDDINISGFTSLEFRIYLAEDDDGSNQDWDASDFFHVDYDIDNTGSFTNLLHVEATGSSGSNFAPALDTNFDGVGNGTEITSAFVQFTESISGTGSTLDLRLTFDLNSGDEDIAIDNIEVYGTSSGGSATKLAITDVHGGDDPVEGETFSVTVQSQDGDDLPANASQDTTVTLSVTGGTGTLSGTLSGTITSGNNSVTITGLSYDVAETFTLNATNTGGSLTADTESVTILADADQLVIKDFPSTGFANTTVTSFTVEAQRSSDNSVDETYTENITIAKVSGSGTIGGTVTKAAVDGVATFDDITFSADDTYTINAGDGTLTSATSSSISISTAVAPTAGALFITEISDAGDFNAEFIELYNSSSSDITLASTDLLMYDASGSTLQNTFSISNFTGSTIVPSNGFLIIARGATEAEFEAEWGALESNTNFSEGSSNAYFGTGRRWVVKESSTQIDSTSNGVGSARDYQFPVGSGTFVTGSEAGATPGLLDGSVSISGTAGWRMLSFPISGGAAEDISDDTAIQGVAGGDNTGETSNFQTYDNTGAFETPASVSTNLGNGYGFITYFYDNTDAGSSELPITLDAAGTEPSSDVSVDLNASTLESGSYYTMVGNPYATNFNLNSITATGGSIQDNVHFWDDGSGSYSAQDRTTPYIVEPWQGFWVETTNSDVTAISMPTSGKTSTAATGTFFSKDNPNSGDINFTLSSETTFDKAIRLSARPDAVLGYDVADASKFTPLVNSYATMAFVGEIENEDKLQSVFSVPSTLEEAITIPLRINTHNASGEFTFAWENVESVSENWDITLTDYETGNTVSLRDASSYTFTINGQAQKSTRSVLAVATTMESNDGETNRFGITITPSTSVGIDDELNEVTEFALEQNYPNPFNPTTNIKYSVGEAGPVNITVYNVMGQKVAELLNTTKNAGSYQLTWNATGVASGIYYYRLTAPGQVLTRQMTLIK